MSRQVYNIDRTRKSQGLFGMHHFRTTIIASLEQPSHEVKNCGARKPGNLANNWILPVPRFVGPNFEPHRI